MDTQQLRVEPQPAGDQHTFSWRITGKDNNKLTILRSDSVRVTLPAEVPIATTTIKVDSEIEQKKPASWQYFSTDDSFRPPVNQPNPIDRLLITLQGIKTLKDLDTSVKVVLTVDGKKSTVDLRLSLAEDPPQITRFLAQPDIVVVGKPITLEWEFNKTSQWGLSVSSGSAVTDPSVQVAAETGLDPAQEHKRSWQIRPKESGRLKCVLHAKRGHEKTVAEVLVQVLARPTWLPAVEGWSEGQVTGLCLSPGGNTLYALVRSESNGSVRGSVWSAPNGLLRWNYLGDVPPEISSTPMVCFSMQSGPVLVFSGGSKIDCERLSDKVWKFDVGKAGAEKAEQCKPARPHWPARAGHVCLVAPDWDTVPKVWVIGGLGKKGETLNDAWVSADLQSWEERKMPQDWQARYLFTAAARESEIWIGGGFSSLDGPPVREFSHLVWETGPHQPANSKVLVRRQSKSLSESNYTLAGLALSVLDNRVYAAGTDWNNIDGHRAIFTEQSVEGSNGRNSRDPLLPPTAVGQAFPVPTVTMCRMEAVAFKGCIWLFSLWPDKEHHQIQGSRLYYWVPA
jgi:hypothetical protein